MSARQKSSLPRPITPTLERILHATQQHGAARLSGEAHLLPAPADGVFPEGFYATTNLETSVRLNEEWHTVANIEMDCGIVIREGEVEPAFPCTGYGRAI